MITRPRKLARVSKASLWALGLLAANALAQSAPTPEEKLEAIRHGLVQAAMDGPTRVQSTAWIDSRGALLESSSFRTGLMVRGVRVQSYERDGQGQLVADLRMQTQSTVGRTPDAKAEPLAQCKSALAGARLQHVIGLEISATPDWKVDDLPAVRSVENHVLNQWRGAANGSVVWRVALNNRGTRSAYQEALLGSSVDHAPWQAKLTLRPLVQPSSQMLATRIVDNAGRLVIVPAVETWLQLELTLTARNQFEPLYSATAQIKWNTDRPNWDVPRPSEEAQALLSAQLQGWSQEIQQRLTCESVQPQVVVAGRDSVRINAGSLAGVRVGDEWLLTGGMRYVQQILEPGVAAQSVLAKVQSVGDHHAQLQLVAGPRDVVQRNWRAWPAEMLR
ncbi:MAG: hypothetical protein WCN21_12100 [Comamonadaceae bacterium]